MSFKSTSSNIIIAPSVLSADFLNLGDEVRSCEAAGCGMIHIDVMDGIFVPNISIGVPVVESIRKATDLPLDVHLMIVEPIKYVKTFRDAGADLITVHYEACEDIVNTIDEIKKSGAKVGVSVKPGTEVDVLEPIINNVDMILVMSVEPGFGGQKYIDSATDKIRKLRKYIDDHNLNIDIQVDGGINLETIKIASEAGANIFVAGTTVFKAEDKKAIISKLQNIAENASK